MHHKICSTYKWTCFLSSSKNFSTSCVFPVPPSPYRTQITCDRVSGGHWVWSKHCFIFSRIPRWPVNSFEGGEGGIRGGRADTTDNSVIFTTRHALMDLSARYDWSFTGFQVTTCGAHWCICLQCNCQLVIMNHQLREFNTRYGYIPAGHPIVSESRMTNCPHLQISLMPWKAVWTTVLVQICPIGKRRL